MYSYGTTSAAFGATGSDFLTGLEEFPFFALPVSTTCGVIWIAILAVVIYRDHRQASAKPSNLQTLNPSAGPPTASALSDRLSEIA